MNGLRKYNYINNKRVEEEVKLFMFIHNLLSLLTYAIKQWRRKYFVKFTHETCSCDASCIFFIATRRTSKNIQERRIEQFPERKKCNDIHRRRIKFIFTFILVKIYIYITQTFIFFSIHL